MKRNNFNDNRFSISKLTALVLVLIVFSACKKTEEISEESQRYCLTGTMKEQTAFHTVKNRQIEERISLNGRVEANPEKMLSFISLVEGLVVNTYFYLGDEVKRGQLLAEIRSAELSAMQAEQRTLSSQLTVANRQLASVISMHKDGIASERDLLQAKSDVDILEAELEKITSNLNLYSSSGTSGLFQIRAPSSGIIIDKNIAPGMQIAAEGDALFTIADLTEVWVLINVYAGNVSSIDEGLQVDIQTMSYPDEVFQGTISRLSQVFDTEERVLRARVVMQNKDLKLKPGMLADIVVKKETDETALAIPTASLIFDNNQNYLMVYKSDCEIEQRTVETLLESNGVTYIKSGVSEGENVVSKNQLILFEQLKNQ